MKGLLQESLMLIDEILVTVDDRIDQIIPGDRDRILGL